MIIKAIPAHDNGCTTDEGCYLIYVYKKQELL